MKLRDFALLTDENVDPEVVQFLEQSGFDVLDVVASGLRGTTDLDLLSRAADENRVVVTHDADFGTLAILGGATVIGIVYLRPGHIRAEFTIETIRTLLNLDPDVTPPFVLVARRTGSTVNMRVRHLEE